METKAFNIDGATADLYDGSLERALDATTDVDGLGRPRGRRIGEFFIDELTPMDVQHAINTSLRRVSPATGRPCSVATVRR